MNTKQRIDRVLQTKPYDFQVDGVAFLENTKGRAVLGDDMGLGKTLQVIAWLALHPEALPALIVCPASLKWHWARELEEHAGIKSHVLSGVRTRVLPEDTSILIVNYDILYRWRGLLQRRVRPNTLILDECHFIKSRKAKRTYACQKLGRQVEHLIALSGTPIVNAPVEFFTTLNLVAPKVFSSFWKFAFRYCAPKRGFRGRGWNFSGASHLDELHERIKPYLLRRKKEEVLKELPTKTRTIIPLDLSNRREYQNARDAFLLWFKNEKGAKATEHLVRTGADKLVRLGALQRLCGVGKVKSTIHWIENWLHETTGKLVIFAIHHAVIDRLKTKFPNAAVVTGKVPPKERDAEVRRFQTAPGCRLFLGTLKAAGQGITLTAASTVLFSEFWWTPGDMDQAEDRVLRIGQTADSIGIYYMTGRETIDDYIISILNEKRRVTSMVLDGVESEQTLVVNYSTIVKRLQEEKKKEGGAK